MRAILSTVTGLTKEGDIGNYKVYHKYIGYDSFDVIRLIWDDINVNIFIVNKGLMKPNNIGRKVFGYPELLFGNMIFTGDVNEDGGTLPLPEEITINTIKILVSDPVCSAGD